MFPSRLRIAPGCDGATVSWLPGLVVERKAEWRSRNEFTLFPRVLTSGRSMKQSSANRLFCTLIRLMYVGQEGFEALSVSTFW